MAELARLIGQTDPFGSQSRAGGQASQRSALARQDGWPQDFQQDSGADVHQDYYGEDEYAQPPVEAELPSAPAGPPAWMQRANVRREAAREMPKELPRELPREFARDFPRALPSQSVPERDDYLSAVHPLHRHAQPPQIQPPEPDSGYYEEPPAYQQPAYQQPAYQQPVYQPQSQPLHDPQDYAEPAPELDPSRYDDALYGQLESGVQDFQREPAYPDDPYAYQGEYDEEPQQPQKRGLPLKVLAVLALGVFGVAAAYGYHTYFGTRRSGEIPIIKADNSPTKIVPAQPDAGAKVPDRMATGDGSEKIVPREEQPVDINSRNVAPRVVFPPLNQNANPPSVASVAPTAMPPAPPAGSATASPGNNGTLPNGEPRKIKTFSVKGDQPDPSAIPVSTSAATGALPAAAAKPGRAGRMPPTQANASANAPLSLSPQGQAAPDTGTQMAATNPTQVAPSEAPSGGYLVPITSQPTEAVARASFRAMQSKYPAVLASQSPVITRATSKSGGVMYRASVGPFGTSAEASQFCHSYESAGGQCWVLKN